jgi:hypothetical protein
MFESYKAESVEKGFKLLLELVQKGSIGLDSDLLLDYRNDPELQDLFSNIFEPQAKVKLIDTINTLYLVPETDNRVFGYTNEQLRQKLKLGDNKELYLAYFLITCLLALFYGSESMEEVQRSYVKYEELERFATLKLRELGDGEESEELEKELEINLRSTKDLWLDMQEKDESITRLRSTTKNRASFIAKVCSFLSDEGLIHEQGTEIYVSEKTEQIIRKFYSDSQQKSKLLSLLTARKVD